MQLIEYKTTLQDIDVLLSVHIYKNIYLWGIDIKEYTISFWSNWMAITTKPRKTIAAAKKRAIQAMQNYKII